MEVHIAFSVMLPECFLMHVSDRKSKKKKVDRKRTAINMKKVFCYVWKNEIIKIT